MKSPIEETRKFKITIPGKELRQILMEAGYEIPEDAHWFTQIYYGETEPRMVANWERKQS